MCVFFCVRWFKLIELKNGNEDYNAFANGREITMVNSIIVCGYYNTWESRLKLTKANRQEELDGTCNGLY